MELYINEENLRKSELLGEYQSVKSVFDSVVSHIDKGGVLFIKQLQIEEQADEILRLDEKNGFEEWKKRKFPLRSFNG